MFMRVTESSKLKTSEKKSLLIAYNIALEPYEITYLTLLTLFEVLTMSSLLTLTTFLWCFNVTDCL